MTIKKIDEPVDFGDFLLFSTEKLDRVINGYFGPQGQLINGLGKEASAEAIIAEYDRIGGLIKTKDDRKIETGTFYDFENRKPKKDISLTIAKEPNKKGIQIKTEEVGDKKKGRKKKKFENEE